MKLAMNVGACYFVQCAHEEQSEDVDTLAPGWGARPVGWLSGARRSPMKILSCFLLVAATAVSAWSADVPPPQKDPVQVDAATEAVIKGALKWLAARQAPNGEWASPNTDERQHPVAITAYALMPFLACGQLPGEGEYGKNVSVAMQYLVDKIQPEGHIGNRADGQYMYGHGIACIALSEIYGQTKNPAIRPKLEKAIKLIIAAQNKEGGWRYRPISFDADISVTVLQVVALRSAKNGGLDVPQKTIDDAVRYVKSCYRTETGGFGYQPGSPAGFARTAAAIYSLQVCGLYEEPTVKKGSQYLVKQFRDGGEWFTYGNFYAAPAQYMQGGETWQRWYENVKRAVLKHVTTQGGLSHWENRIEGDRYVGPIYHTAVFTMILAMPYHYVPLYQR
jgi:prenyltransferase beta subunit